MPVGERTFYFNNANKRFNYSFTIQFYNALHAFFCYLFSVIFVSAFAGPGINMWCDTFVFGGTASLSTYVLRTKIPRDMRWRKWPSQQISRRGLPANVINVSCVSPRKFQLDDWFVRENEEFHIFFLQLGKEVLPQTRCATPEQMNFFAISCLLPTPSWQPLITVR